MRSPRYKDYLEQKIVEVWSPNLFNGFRGFGDQIPTVGTGVEYFGSALEKDNALPQYDFLIIFIAT